MPNSKPPFNNAYEQVISCFFHWCVEAEKEALKKREIQQRRNNLDALYWAGYAAGCNICADHIATVMHYKRED